MKPTSTTLTLVKECKNSHAYRGEGPFHMTTVYIPKVILPVQPPLRIKMTLEADK